MRARRIPSLRLIVTVLATLLLAVALPSQALAEGTGGSDDTTLANGGGHLGEGEGAAAPAAAAPIPNSTSTTVAPASTWQPPGINGLDVYSGTGNVDWAGQYALGARFAYVKATESTTYTNPLFASQYNGAAGAGLIRGAYHYALPPRSSGADQARFFFQHGGGWSADGITLAPMLDLEWNPYPTTLGNSCYDMSPAELVAWTQDFVNTLTALVNRPILIYTSTSWWSLCVGSTAFGDQSLFAARYNQVGPAPLPTGWSNWSFWQYSASGPYAGDSDVWNGTLDELRAWAKLSYQAAPTVASLYTPVTPARVLDTRIGTGALAARVPAGATVSLKVAGVGGVPSTGVTAISLNLTATTIQAAGYVTAYPSDGRRPTVSNINFVTGQVVANLCVVKVGSDGKVNLYNGSAGTLDLVADVQGYFTAAGSQAPGALVALSPTRILDTRSGLGAPATALGARGTLALTVTGRGGVPSSGVAAVVLNVTATLPTAAGFITVSPTGGNRPVASNVNFAAGQSVPNGVIATVGAGGSIDLYNGSDGTVHLVVDVAGYFLAGSPATPGAYVSLSPTRLLDTRGDNTVPGSPLTNHTSRPLTVTGGPVPGGGVAAVCLNVTVTNTEAPGYLTVYPTGSNVPLASNVNFVSGTTVPTMVIARVAGGQVSLYNGSDGYVDVVVDLTGYFLG